MTGLQQLAGNLAASYKNWPLLERTSRGDLDALRDTIRTLPVDTLKHFYVNGRLTLPEFEQAVDWLLEADRGE